MEDLGWLRNMWLPWSNMNHHHNQQEIEDSFMFCSENIFSNPIQDLRKTNSNILLNPITTSCRITPATTDSSSFGAANQHWSQTTGFNSFHDGENVIPTTTTAAAATVKSVESLDCLLSGTNSNANSSSDHDDGFSIIFPDYKNLCNNIINNLTGVSDDSVTKDIDDGIASKSSSAKRLNHNSMIHEHYQPRSKKSRSDPGRSTSSTINFRQETSESDETDSEEITQMKEMIYRTAAFRPVIFSDEEAVEKPRRKNVRISSDPQTVAARQRREKISERIRVLQKLVPGGNKMDTASMLDEAANYLKFLRSQVKALEQCGQKFDYRSGGTTTNAQSANQIVQNFGSSNVTLGIPFPMQTHFLLPQQLYPAPPPA